MHVQSIAASSANGLRVLHSTTQQLIDIDDEPDASSSWLASSLAAQGEATGT